MTAPSAIALRPGVSVVLRRYPRGPVMVTLARETKSDVPLWTVAWLDEKGNRREQRFAPQELMVRGELPIF